MVSGEHWSKYLQNFMEKEMATHSSTLAWKILWPEERGRLQSMGSVTESDMTGWLGFPGSSEVKASDCNAGDLGSNPGLGRSPAERNGNPLQYSCLENPMDGGAWWATVHGVAKSRTRLSDFTFTFSDYITSSWRLAGGYSFYLLYTLIKLYYTHTQNLWNFRTLIKYTCKMKELKKGYSYQRMK